MREIEKEKDMIRHVLIVGITLIRVMIYVRTPIYIPTNPPHSDAPHCLTPALPFPSHPEAMQGH